MSTPVGVDAFATAVSGLMADVTLRASQTVSPTPGRVILVAPGATVAHDDCCLGQVWVRLASITPPPGADPSRKPGMAACALPHMLATFELGIIRCAATVNDQGRAPSAGQITADGEQSIQDMAALLGVLRCTDKIRGITSWTPTGPEGGCHGGYWTFQILLNNCIACEEDDNDGG